MKKLIFLFCLISITLLLKANPRPVPMVYISELAFDSTGKWTLEISCLNSLSWNYTAGDSIWIKTKSGISAINPDSCYVIDYENVMVVTINGMMSNLAIDPESDSIKIFDRQNTWESAPTLVYGSYPNAVVRAPKPGESIMSTAHQVNFNSDDPYAYHYESFDGYCLCGAPTFGFANNYDFYYFENEGQIQGCIYDKNNHPLTSNYLVNVFSHTIRPDDYGHYSLTTLAKNYPCSEVYYIDSTAFSWNKAHRNPIDPFVLTLDPNKTVTIDIHLKDSLYTNLQDIFKEELSIVKISPNPVTGLSLNYEIVLPVASSNCRLNLTDMNGLSLGRFLIRESKGTIDLPASLKNGIYLMNLEMNGRSFGRSKIQIFRK